MADFAEENRQVFDKMAGSYLEGFAEAIQTLIRQVQSRRLWLSDQWTDTEEGSGKELKMLEYACGPGAISMTLVPYVTKILGLDLSDNMVNEYNKNADQNGYANKMSARTGDILTDPVPAELSGAEYFDFDIVVVSMALHHFDDASKALKYLGDRLKKGGTCVIIDIAPDHLSDHHHNHVFAETAQTVRTHGFTLEQMRDSFTNAGMGSNFGYQVFEEPVVFQKDGKTISKTLFAARAKRT